MTTGRRSSHAGQIVATQSYALLDPTVDSQVQQLKASGADTFVIFALPKQAIQAFVVAAKLGWKPTEYVTSVSIDPAVMQIVHLNAGKATGVGATSTAFLHDPTNPTQRTAPGVKLYRQIMKTYLPNEDWKAVAPDLWPLWKSLGAPILAIRGATSDILSVSTLERMKREKPDLRTLTAANRGHTPLLDEPECLAAIDEFLAAGA